MSFLDELAWRGQLHQTTSDAELREHLATPGRVCYCGFDPTADSLTIGNYIPIKLLMLWQRCGHKPIIVVGGGTGLIGDPSGKDAERGLLSRETVTEHVERYRPVFERLLDFDPANPNAAVIVNNLDWLDGLGYVEMLRDVGKHFSVNTMIQKDSVRDRLHHREQGISYTEFSYMILQAYDFLHLRREMNCTVQMAGSDQFGNIVAGIDLIRRAGLPHAYGITAPLLLTAEGKKIGKTEKGAVWLNADRTSSYAFYQYWINVTDDDVVNMLRWFTLLEQDEIEGIASTHEAAPHERHAQRALARWMTDLVHGAPETKRAEAASRALFTGDVSALDADLLGEVFADVPASTHAKVELEGDGVSLVELLPQTTLASSKRQAREFLTGGAVSVNGRRVTLDDTLKTTDLLAGGTILLKRGKKSWHATKWS
jgi:tyrosyl-tRNA synthetase